MIAPTATRVLDVMSIKILRSVQLKDLYVNHIILLLDAYLAAGVPARRLTKLLLNRLVRDYTRLFAQRFTSLGAQDDTSGLKVESDHFVPVALTVNRILANDLPDSPTTRRRLIRRHLQEGAIMVEMLKDAEDGKLNRTHGFKQGMPSIKTLVQLNPVTRAEWDAAPNKNERRKVLQRHGPIAYEERYTANGIHCPELRSYLSHLYARV